MNQVDHKAALLRAARRVVVKVGSNVLATDGGVNAPRIRALARELAAIGTDREVVLVTSGAVAAGQSRLGIQRRGLEWRQAAAAVGQPGLMALYERGFASRQRTVAQILVTHADLADRRRYLNARHTILHLLAAGVVPIVNENDTVSVEELKFGDNDDLSALIATLIDAHLLVILSDVTGLHGADPRRDPTAARIAVAEARSPDLDAVAGPARRGVGTGGMRSKLAAARTAAAAGIPTVIADGTRRGVLARIFDARKAVGTLLLAPGDPLTRRKHWIAHTLKPKGTLHADRGAQRAVVDAGRSLLPTGLQRVEGTFGRGDCVRCVGPDGREFARGLVNYSSNDTEKLCGAQTADIESRLGYKGNDEVVHRDDLVVVALPMDLR